MAAPKFNVILGSETGFLKGINTSKDIWRNFNAIEVPQKSNEIISLNWIAGSESKLSVGSRDKRVAIFDIDNFYFSEYELFNSGDGDLKSAMKIDKKTFVGLETGSLSVWSDGEIVQSIETGMNLSCMALNGNGNNILGTGGKESELKLWDLNNDLNQPRFEAKNVRNDWLNLRVPVWVTGIEYLDSSKVITCTGHHQVRVYDPSVQRRPVLDMTWDEYPLTAMSLYHDNQVIVGNTQGNMALLDLRKGKLIHQFKGFAGSIRSLKCNSSQSVVASCGLDRFLRLHDVNTKQLLYKKYMKSRLNCLLMTKQNWKDFGDEEVQDGVPVDADSSKQADNDDDIWDHMEVVKTRTVKRHLKDEGENFKQNKYKKSTKKM
ncbi:WD repeat-containing protein 74-like [Mya arenaria]|uniref:WD repeat-containing protein 74-like n=1 Tax=Mya arenaria TaxID=6604 RepID=UPI0022E46599|nr:WD repeat-containing protein 74-like [Mya arenaria]